MRWLVTSQTDTEAWGTSKGAWKLQSILNGEIVIILARHSLPLILKRKDHPKGSRQPDPGDMTSCSPSQVPTMEVVSTG